MNLVQFSFGIVRTVELIREWKVRKLKFDFQKADRERENLYLLIQKICLNQNQNEDPRVGLGLEDKGMILS